MDDIKTASFMARRFLLSPGVKVGGTSVLNHYITGWWSGLVELLPHGLQTY